jgi:hypothetical protein
MPQIHESLPVTIALARCQNTGADKRTQTGVPVPMQGPFRCRPTTAKYRNLDFGQFIANC